MLYFILKLILFISFVLVTIPFIILAYDRLSNLNGLGRKTEKREDDERSANENQVGEGIQEGFQREVQGGVQEGIQKEAMGGNGEKIIKGDSVFKDGYVKFEKRGFFIAYIKEFLSYVYLISTWVLGFFSLESYVPRKKGIKAPVFIIPGYFLTKSALYPLFYMLRNRGFENIFLLDASPFTGSIEDISLNCIEKIRSVFEDLGGVADGAGIVLVGHSLGGLVAKYITERGDFKVLKCITVCTPHMGTRMAFFGFGKSALDMRPWSNFVESLKQVKNPSVYLCISSLYDQLTLPYQSSFIDGTEKIEYDYMGHFSPIFSGRLADDILNIVKKLNMIE